MTEQFARELAVKLRELLEWHIDRYPYSLDELVLSRAIDVLEEVAVDLHREASR